MPTFELLLFLLLLGSGLSLVSGRLQLPYPAVLAVAGVVLALIPGMPSLVIDPTLVLALFVAPVLLDAAFDTSLRDLRDNWRPVAALSVVLVGVTTLVVALAARAMVPEMGWPVAVALGAMVAPPDAAAATSVLGRLSPPHRLVVVLEGESLLNDAAALLVWRLALIAAAGTLTWSQAVPTFLLTAVGGVVAGYVLGRLYLVLTKPVDEVATGVLLQFVATFSVWLIADRLGLSAIVTMVAYGLTLSRAAPARLSARGRIASNSVWTVAVHGLNILAFIVMGLQLRAVLHRLAGHWPQVAGFAVAVCATVILVRIVWVMAYNVLVGWKNRRFGPDLRRPMMLPNWRTGTVVAWCGMRGVVTLATALALPEGFGSHGAAYRDLLIFTAFSVVLATLVLQGLSLPVLLARLGLSHDDTVAGEVRMARAETARAALAVLQGDDYPVATLRREYRARLRRADAGDVAVDPPELARTRRQVLDAEREALVRLRAEERIGDAAYHRLEEELDWAEVDTEARVQEP